MTGLGQIQTTERRDVGAASPEKADISASCTAAPPATRAQLRQPHSIAVDPSDKLLICDIGNQRIRQVDFSTGVIETYGGTGERQPTPDGAAVKNAPNYGL
jgi:hypothetical protein